jgi:hypothetical protein
LESLRGLRRLKPLRPLLAHRREVELRGLLAVRGLYVRGLLSVRLGVRGLTELGESGLSRATLAERHALVEWLGSLHRLSPRTNALSISRLLTKGGLLGGLGIDGLLAEGGLLIGLGIDRLLDQGRLLGGLSTWGVG